MTYTLVTIDVWIDESDAVNRSIVRWPMDSQDLPEIIAKAQELDSGLLVSIENEAGESVWIRQ